MASQLQSTFTALILVYFAKTCHGKLKNRLHSLLTNQLIIQPGAEIKCDPTKNGADCPAGNVCVKQILPYFRCVKAQTGQSCDVATKNCTGGKICARYFKKDACIQPLGKKL